MKNLSISILNVENVGAFLEKLNEANNKLNDSKRMLVDTTIHFDVMDNEFVPNTGVDIEKIKEVVKYGYYVDTHLMVARPIEDGYIDKAIEYGSKDITIHIEIEDFERNLEYLLQKKNEIKDFKVGVSIKPNTSVETLEKYIDVIDKVLVMSVEPGFGGQKYLDSATEKIRTIKEKYNDIFVQVDGGVNSETLTLPIDAGVDSIVVGSYLTKNEDKLLDGLTLINITNEIHMYPRRQGKDLDFHKRTLQAVPGGYGENDNILGICSPNLRKTSKVWYNIISVDVLKHLMLSPIHEERNVACFILDEISDSKKVDNTFVLDFIDENKAGLNNWDLVDTCVPICIGKRIRNESDEYIYNYLRKYTISDHIWTKRIGIVSLLYIAKIGRKNVVLKVIDDNFFEEYHLTQKANGWVLRELYKTCPKDVLEYLQEKSKHARIPRILRSYACEKMTKEEKSKIK